jgi:hypothetical protein
VTVYPISTRVVIDGVQAYDDGDSFLAGLPTIVDGLSFTWGRQTNVDQPDPGTCTFTLHEELFGTVTPMLDAINVDQSVKVWVDITQPDSTVTSVLTWAGTVTEVNGAAVGYSAFQVAVTAADAAAPLADETIKDAPWIVQPVQTRVNRILQLANTDTAPITIDPSVASYSLTWREVDAEPVLALLQDIAQSVGGVLWVTTRNDGTTYMWIEDPSSRPSSRKFVINGTTGVVTIQDDVPATAQVTSIDVLRDPIQWTRSKSQAINSVDVTWQQQGIDDTGKPTATATTTTITQPSTKIFRKLSIDTELISSLDASDLASRMLALMGGTRGWMATNVAIDSTILEFDLTPTEYASRLGMIQTLLDGESRVGCPLTLIDIPSWAPGGPMASIYIEGGTYTLTGQRWTFELNVSSSTGAGQSATFADFAGTGAKWSDFDPSIRFQDAYGVAGPNSITAGFGAGQFGVQAFGV